MSTRIRSSSMGAMPRPKKHFTSRAESTAAASLDVRCACQFFQSDSLLPERINPVGSRPSSSQGYYSRPISSDLTHHVFEPDYKDPESQRKFSFGVVCSTDYYSDSADVDKPTINSQQNMHLSSNIGRNLSNTPTDRENQIESLNLQRDPSESILLERKGYQNSMDKLRQKDPSQSVLLRRRRSESAQKNLENIGRQRDPSTSSILRRRFSEKSLNNIQQKDLSKSSLLQRRMDSPGNLQPQSSIEEPLAKEPKLQFSTPVRESPHQPTNAERFMLSKSIIQSKPSIELSDLYRETMTFSQLESEEKPKPKTIDVGILDLMTLGTSFIQKGVVKSNMKEKKSRTDEGNGDGTPTQIENEVDETQESLTNTTDDQVEFSSPTSTALVHIGQNIYIEEPGDPSKETILPGKIERLSRRDYPDKVNNVEAIREVKKAKLVDDEHETVENISTTLLPRDLREQSTFIVDGRKIESELKNSTPSECIKKRDLSTSSLLQKRYSQNCNDDLPQSIDLHTASSSPSHFMKQRDASSSSLVRKRYGQSMDDHLVSDNSTSIAIQNMEELPSIELMERKAVSFENVAEAADSHSADLIEIITKNLLSSTTELKDKMDLNERTYHTR